VVKDGAAEFSGQRRTDKHSGEPRKGPPGWRIVLIPTGSSTIHGSVDGYSKGKVYVDIAEKKTYSIGLESGLMPPGQFTYGVLYERRMRRERCL